ncbi:hypothetical protein [Sulfitobacter donghicola]|uniref:Uncharacterized protein n=1 Tax=Sulfitobacter donghicola DSW-25 = KCTC 12864 = JCM 14565 TaxID=1300350 RepID=A0A073IFL0_9RHOB|nr:hypothetical protein [Sulfitobacter donghicola]KEJ89133.1 hypothetical protein DSW25_12990 [Sulfitobacter donghicola DSW-25 = KCTC 12864 = JCM 14565]KIN67290.1 hypothetical protein Z948_1003 [Sulfitobacter donghicola DSW-25 = KCTC 12864 = JCM 14565]
MFYRLTFFLFILSAQLVNAGPWLREKGSAFTAVSFSSTYYLETSNQTYLEYGLTDSTTLVADVSFVRLHYVPSSGYATFSLRRSFGPEEGKSKWAYELGFGAGWIGSETLPHIRTALSWGKGIKWGEKSGWSTVEAAILWDLTHELHVGKIDTTIGLNFTDTTAGMLQLYTAFVENQSVATIAPSIVLSPKNSKFRFQVGTESEIGNWGNTALKLALWREF